CQCLDPIGDGLGAAYGRSITGSDYLCRRTGMGSPVWPSGRRTFTVTGFIRRIDGGTWRDCQRMETEVFQKTTNRRIKTRSFLIPLNPPLKKGGFFSLGKYG